jgi:hypothetical protein
MELKEHENLISSSALQIWEIELNLRLLSNRANILKS